MTWLQTWPPTWLQTWLQTPALLAVLFAAPVVGWISARLAARLSDGAPATARRLWGMVAAELAMAGLAAASTTGWALAVSLALGAVLVLLAAVDIAVHRLPDVLTLPLIVAGLAAGPWLLGAPPADHLAGALLGFAAFAGTGWAYARLRGREGLGLGDAKLCAAAGAWLGWAALPSFVVLACGAGLAWVGLTALRGAGSRLRLSSRLPFGPALCVAFWTMWLLAHPSS